MDGVLSIDEKVLITKRFEVIYTWQSLTKMKNIDNYWGMPLNHDVYTS